MRTRDIKEFLMRNARPELASLYTANMEVQVNVVPGKEPISGTTSAGHTWRGWQGKGGEVFKHFRIPFPDLSFQDKALGFDLATHVEAIGMTGWNWKDQASSWVGYDFDALLGHVKGLSDEALELLVERTVKVPWLTVRRSKGGKGLHLYVFFATPVPTASREEHAALARSLLGRLVAATGLDLQSQVDKLGCNLWVWHKSTKPNGMALIHEGTPLPDSEVPANWKDHVAVVQGRRARVRVKRVEGSSEAEELDELVNRNATVELDDEHRRLLGWFAVAKSLDGSCPVTWWWDSDRHMLVCHTNDLKRAHGELSLRGLFYTVSTGKGADDQNCFAFPLRKGAWAVRRHGRGTLEHAAWTRDPQGWTRCFLNTPAELAPAASAHDGLEDAKGDYIFASVALALQALKDLGGTTPPIPDSCLNRRATLKPHDGNRVLFSWAREETDSGGAGWLLSKKKDHWQAVVVVTAKDRDPEPPDDLLRSLVTQEKDAGWYLRITEPGNWIAQCRSNVISALIATGVARSEIDPLLGHAVLRPWSAVCLPFQPEYPGNRRWNMKAAQLSVVPNQGSYTTWDWLLGHVGASLDEEVRKHEWCIKHGVNTGGLYLKAWFASLIQEPLEPTPYLFLWGPQKSGKSILHEQFGRLLSRGYVKADNALTNKQRFNGELQGAVLCVVEEVHLRQDKGAYDRIKDWVTCKTLSVHPKGGTPFDVMNSTHWMQCANGADYCPIMPGDTRITMMYVDEQLDPKPKPEVEAKLWAEGPAFLHELKKYELPPPADRLRLPTISSTDKREQEEANKSELERFLHDCCWSVPGAAVRAEAFYEAFLAYLPTERRGFWTQGRVRRELPRKYPKGRYKGGGYAHYGNLSLFDTPPEKPLIHIEGFLKEAR